MKRQDDVWKSLKALYQMQADLLQGKELEEKRQGAFGQPVFGEGNWKRPKLMLIGEAPGAEETQQKKPFVGKAGRQLDELLQQAGIERNEIFITNVVKYRPYISRNGSLRNRTPDKEEVLFALPLLKQELLLVQPQLVATLGNVPLNALLALAGEQPSTIGKMHGKKRDCYIAGRVIAFYPLYHPASTIYNPALRDTCKEDIMGLANLL